MAEGPSTMMIAPVGQDGCGGIMRGETDSGNIDSSQFEIYPQYRRCPSELYTSVSTRNWNTANNAQAGYRDRPKSTKVDEFLKYIATGDETLVHHFAPHTKQTRMQRKHSTSPTAKRFTVCHFLKKNDGICVLGCRRSHSRRVYASRYKN